MRRLLKICAILNHEIPDLLNTVVGEHLRRDVDTAKKSAKRINCACAGAAHNKRRRLTPRRGLRKGFLFFVQWPAKPRTFCGLTGMSIAGFRPMNFATYYAQVFSIGFIWVFFHCGGMCGPILAGITSDIKDSSRPRELARRAGRVLSYQTGRAITHAVIGAVAGLVGSAFESSLRDFTQVAGLVLSVVLVLVGLTRLPPWAHKFSSGKWASQGGALLGRGLMTLQRRGPKSGFLRYLMLGAMMGLLPCMLMFWVLSIATSTASPMHGAGVMVLLVLMTTPTLLVAGCAAALGGRHLHGEWIAPLAMIVSGIWLGLIAGAANGWLDHIHIQFSMFGEKYVLMLF